MATKLRIRWKEETSVEGFIARRYRDLDHEKIFVPTSRPLDVGKEVAFELLLADRSPLFSGRGRVIEVRRRGPAGEAGMVIRYDTLSESAITIIERASMRRQLGVASNEDDLVPPDADTLDAPAPKMDDLE